MSDTVKNPLVNQTRVTTFDEFVQAMLSASSEDANPEDVELSIVPSDFTKGVVSTFNAFTKTVTNFFSEATPQEKQKNDIKDVLSDGANINFQDDKGRSALHWAVMNENPGLAGFLIDQGVDKDLQDKQGRTAFHYLVDKLEEKPVGMAVVALSNKRDLLSIFKNNQMNLSVTDNAGKNVLHLLAEKSNVDVMSVLLKPNKGAKYNWNADAASKVQDKLGNTPLHYAAQNGNIMLISALSEYSNPHLENKKQQTPFDLVHDVYKEQVAKIIGSERLVEKSIKVEEHKQAPIEAPSPPHPVVQKAIVVKSEPSWMDRIKQMWDAVLTWFKGQEEDRKAKYLVKDLDVTKTDTMTDSGKKTMGGIKQQPVPLSKGVPPVVTSKADSTSDNEENFKPKPDSGKGDYWVQP